HFTIRGMRNIVQDAARAYPAAGAPSEAGTRWTPTKAIFRILARRKPAQIQSTATVSHATGVASNPKMPVPPGRAEGTISLELLTDAWSSMVRSRLPLVRT